MLTVPPGRQHSPLAGVAGRQLDEVSLADAGLTGYRHQFASRRRDGMQHESSFVTSPDRAPRANLVGGDGDLGAVPVAAPLDPIPVEAGIIGQDLASS